MYVCMYVCRVCVFFPARPWPDESGSLSYVQHSTPATREKTPVAAILLEGVLFQALTPAMPYYAVLTRIFKPLPILHVFFYVYFYLLLLHTIIIIIYIICILLYIIL